MSNRIAPAGLTYLVVAAMTGYGGQTVADVVVSGLTATRIEPVAMLRNNAIAACGFEAVAQSGTVQASIALTLFADSAQPDGTRMILAGAWRYRAETTVSQPEHIVALRFKTATVDVSTRPSALKQREDGRFEGHIELTALDGAQLVRETLLSGAVATLATLGNASLNLTVQGPAPHSVRAAYLNCAGDLFRPEAASQVP